MGGYCQYSKNGRGDVALGLHIPSHPNINGFNRFDSGK